MVITYHDPTFKAIVAVLRVLQEKWDEGLDFKDLGCLFHQDVVVSEA